MNTTEPVPVGSVEPLVMQARAARRNGDRAAALAAFEAATALNPKHVGLKAETAAELRALGRLDDAETICREALAIEAKHASCLAELGYIARQRGDRCAALAAFKTAIAAHPAHATLKVQAAIELRELGRLAEAKALCQEALTLEPTHIGALAELGQIERRGGDRESALAACRRAIAVDPGHLGFKAQAAADLRELGRHDEAEALCREVLSIDPHHVGCLAELGHLARYRGDHPAALAAFAAASAMQPKHVGLKAHLATELRELGRPDEAEAACRQALAIDPDHLGCLAELGHIARRRGDRTAAVAAFQAAITLHRAHIGLRLQAASDLRELGKLEEAEALCQSALAIEPNHAAALAELGQIARRKGNREAALAAFQAAAAVAPSRTQFKIEAALDFRELGRLDEAENVLRKALDLEPRHSIAWMWLGHFARRRGDRAAARAAFEAALAGDLKGVGPALDITAALCELGHIETAEARFLQRLDRNSDDTAALLSLGRLRLEQFRLDEAQELFRRATQGAPNEPVCWLSLARLARRCSDHEAALEYLQVARAANPSHVGTMLETAAELRDLGRFNEARSMIAAVLKTSPRDFAATMQLAYVHRSQGERRLALEIFSAAHRLQSQQPQALIEMALEHRALGQPRQSEELLRRALELWPQHQGALEQLAEHHFLAEDFEKALVLSRQSISLYLRRHTPYLRASRAAAELGRSEEAVKLLDKAEALAGPYPEIRAMRASHYMRERDWNKVHEIILAAGPERKNHQCLWSISTKFAITIGDYETAEEELPSSVSARHDASRVQLFRGQIAEGRWQLQRAASHYRAAVLLSPDDGGAHYDLARTSLKLLDLEACRRHLTRQVEIMTSSLKLRGQSNHVSQTHVGQLLDEFGLDREQLEQLRHVRCRPKAEQIEPLKEMVRLNPDHTPTAIMLLIAMRETGVLVTEPKTTANQGPDETTRLEKIPQRVVQYWDNAELPAEIQALMDSWQRAHPGFDIVRLNDQSAQEFLRQHGMRDTLRAYRRAREPAQRADLIRLAYLAVHGGFYADADDRCRAPLGSYVPRDASFVTFQEDFGTLGNNLLGAAPSHPVIELALELGTEAINRGDHDFLWLATGPGLLTRAFAQIISRPAGEMPEMADPTILDMAFTAKRIGFHCPVSYKRTQRHWSRSSFRRRRSAPLNEVDSGAYGLTPIQ